MAIKMVAIKCPECGATLDIEEGRKQIFCSYCGTKVMVQNDNEYIYRHIDEAGIKQAETDQMVRMKQLEIVEKRRHYYEKSRKQKIKGVIILGIVGFLMEIIGILAEDASVGPFLGIMGIFLIFGAVMLWFNIDLDDMTDIMKDDDFGDKVKVPSLNDYQNQSYKAIEAKLRSAGFTNIKCVPLNDLRFAILKKPNMVESITINGNETTYGGKKYLPDADVVITYHSMG